MTAGLVLRLNGGIADTLDHLASLPPIHVPSESIEQGIAPPLLHMPVQGMQLGFHHPVA